MLEDLDFADPFPVGTQAHWRQLVERVLKGAPFDRLVSRTADGIPVQPLYQRARDAGPLHLRAEAAAWRIASRIDHPDTDQASAQIREDLAQGATALHLVVSGSRGAHGFGLPGDRDSLATCLAGLDLEAGPLIELDPGPQMADVSLGLADWFAARHFDPARMAISFGIDPVGALLSPASNLTDWPKAAEHATGACTALRMRGYYRRLCVADGRVVHAAGGTEAQELAFAMTSAIACLRLLEGAGFDIDAACGAISFRLAADADQLLTIAKLRAARRLWARIVAACGAPPQPMHLHAETAWRMMSRRDPWVNMLRTTMACFGAAVGGADVITVQGFTQALGLPDPAARRIARNTQVVLLEESGLARVLDPAAGAGSFEALTGALCEKSWELLQEIERAGGLPQSLADGTFQSRVEAAANKRAQAIAHRTLPITGTSTFPALQEAPVSVLAPCPSPPSRRDGAANRIKPLVEQRDAQAFEALRDQADRMARTQGRRPRIFLANLGSLAEATPRSLFARSFFEAGGIEAVGPEHIATLEDLTAAFRSAETPLACLCSSDHVYEQQAENAAQALKTAGAAFLYLAGRPGDREAAWRACGITDFVFAGCHAVVMLEQTLERVAS